MVRRTASSPGAIVVRASASVASAGWTGARLAPVEARDANERIRVFSFVATSPEMPGKDRFPQTMETEIRVDDVRPEMRTVRVVSATNAISAPIAR